MKNETQMETRTDADQEDMDVMDSEIDFGALIASLATSALLHLGESYPDEEPSEIDLPLAKQSIEIIGMLREKTRGNLTKEEQQLIDEVLYDLRRKFLEVSPASVA